MSSRDASSLSDARTRASWAARYLLNPVGVFHAEEARMRLDVDNVGFSRRPRIRNRRTCTSWRTSGLAANGSTCRSHVGSGRTLEQWSSCSRMMLRGADDLVQSRFVRHRHQPQRFQTLPPAQRLLAPDPDLQQLPGSPSRSGAPCPGRSLERSRVFAAAPAQTGSCRRARRPHPPRRPDERRVARRSRRRSQSTSRGAAPLPTHSLELRGLRGALDPVVPDQIPRCRGQRRALGILQPGQLAGGHHQVPGDVVQELAAVISQPPERAGDGTPRAERPGYLVHAADPPTRSASSSCRRRLLWDSHIRKTYSKARPFRIPNDARDESRSPLWWAAAL